MSLRVRSLRFHQFRNYSDIKLEDIGQLVVFTGPNAAGKTNLVEGIQLLTALDSFRSPKTEQLITWGKDQAYISLIAEDGERHLDIGLALDARGRHYRLNGKQRPRQELQGILPAVMFSPDDLQLVKGAPEVRRAAMDALGIQVSRNYLSVKRDYEKILRQKTDPKYIRMFRTGFFQPALNCFGSLINASGIQRELHLLPLHMNFPLCK